MTFIDVLAGAGLALAATAAGAAGVFGLGAGKKCDCSVVLPVCAGVMAFSSIEMARESAALAGWWSTAFGVALGGAFLLVLERILPHAHVIVRKKELEHSKKKAALLAGAITLHNVPEGFAIASAFASSNALGWLVALSISIQDVPEGTVVSAPLRSYGMPARSAFFWGVFSGVVEFMAAIAGYLVLGLISAIIPIALAFSAGAMASVIIFELLADSLRGGKWGAVALSFIGGAAGAYALSALLAF